MSDPGLRPASARSRAASRLVVPLLLVALLWPLPARGAGEAPRERPADAEVLPLLAEALEKNPELPLARHRAAAARARVAPAGALPDPMASLVYQKGEGRFAPGANDDTFLGVMVSQELPFPGKRAASTAVAAREAERMDAPVARVALSIEAALRTAWADLLLARELIATIDEERAVWAEIEEATRARYAAGLATQQDVVRAQAERSRLLPMRAHEEGNVVMAVASINRLLGRPSGTPAPATRRLSETVPVGERDVPLPLLAELLAMAEERSPELREARLAVAAAEARLSLARLEVSPDFSVSAGYLNRGGMAPMVTASLGVGVPLWRGRKQRERVVEAEAEKRAAEAALEALRAAVRVALERDHAELAAAVKEAEPYPKAILPQDRLSVEAALASYRAGQVPFTAVLEALQTLYQDRRAHLERLVHVLWHEAALFSFMPAPAAGGMPILSTGDAR